MKQSTGTFQFSNLSLEDLHKEITAYVGDGAKVNTERLNGVISIVQREVNQFIVMIKCMSHRVELAPKDAMKTSNLFKQLLEL